MNCFFDFSDRLAWVGEGVGRFRSVLLYRDIYIIGVLAEGEIIL